MATVLEPRFDRGPSPGSSNRSFGFVFGVMFIIIALWPLLHGNSPRWWALGIALGFGTVALIRPQLLHPLNRAWLTFGHLMHRLVSPIVMGGIFFLCVTPTAWIMQLRGKDLLSLRRRPELKSYWIDRETSPLDSQSMKNQY